MKLLRAASAALVIVLLAAACDRGGDPTPSEVPDSGSEPTGDGGAVVVGATLEPPTLDISENAAAAIGEVFLYNVQEGLVKLDDEGEIQPLLAEDWEQSDDGLTYTFNLVEASFHDGTPLTADDVVFSFEAVRAEESTHPFKTHMDPVDTIEATDERTVEVTLKNYSNNWLFNMAQAAGVVFSEAAYESRATEPVGTGPFRFEEWTKGDNIRLVRNDDYWGEAALLEGVTFKYIEDPNALNNALLAGDIDIISRVTGPEALGQFEDDDRFEVVDGLTNGEIILALNNTQAPLDDPKVRQAITMAIDREGLIQAAYSGYGEPIGSHVPPQDPWYVDTTGTYPYDPEAAQTLLEEAGHADDISLTLTLPPPSYAARSGEIIASQLGEVGIDVEIESVEFPAWLDTVFAGEFDMSIISHVEARDIVQYGNPEYYWHYDNPQVAEWLTQADQAVEEAERDELYGRVQEQIAEDAVNVWLFLLPNLAVVSTDVEGYPPNRISTSLDMTGVSTSG